MSALSVRRDIHRPCASHNSLRLHAAELSSPSATLASAVLGGTAADLTETDFILEGQNTTPSNADVAASRPPVDSMQFTPRMQIVARRTYIPSADSGQEADSSHHSPSSSFSSPPHAASAFAPRKMKSRLVQPLPAQQEESGSASESVIGREIEEAINETLMLFHHYQLKEKAFMLTLSSSSFADIALSPEERPFHSSSLMQLDDDDADPLLSNNQDVAALDEGDDDGDEDLEQDADGGDADADDFADLGEVEEASGSVAHSEFLL